jgi:uncharacterized protein (UPF0297 family)
MAMRKKGHDRLAVTRVLVAAEQAEDDDRKHFRDEERDEVEEELLAQYTK